MKIMFSSLLTLPEYIIQNSSRSAWVYGVPMKMSWSEELWGNINQT